MTLTFETPANPGTYVRFVSEETSRPPSSVAATVAIPIVADWGPVGATDGVIKLNSFSDFEAKFGNSPSDARDAVLGAFLGPGVSGVPGAGTVLVYRMGVVGQIASATRNLLNTTPATGLRIDAKYPGVRGNRIKLVVEDDPLNAANQQLRVLFDDVNVERYVFPDGICSNLKAAVNLSSNYIVGVGTAIDGVNLANLAATSLSGGNDGSAFTGTEYVQALGALEFEPFSVFVPANVTDAGILASIRTWVITMANAQRPIVAVLGGPAAETFSAAQTRTGTVRDEHIVSLGAGDFYDSFLAKNVSTAQVAPRVAGALAGLGEERSLTFLKFGGLKFVGTVAIVTDSLADAARLGITAFRRTSSVEAELMIARGVTTYIDTTNPAKTVAIFSDPRLVRVGDLFIREVRLYGDDFIVGQTTVSEETKAAVRSRGNRLIADRVDRGLLLPGVNVADRPFFRVVDPVSVGAPEDSVPFEFGWRYTKTTNYLIGNGRVR